MRIRNIHILLTALACCLLLPAVISTAQEKYIIVSIYPSSSKVRINNAYRDVNYVFSEGDRIDFEKGQEITAKNLTTNRLCIFSEESFASKKAKTIAQYLGHNQLSSRGEWTMMQGMQKKQAFPEKRIALVIGNANYEFLQPLQNSISDAHAVANKLLSLGFNVMTGYDLQSGEYGRGDEFHDIVRKFYKYAEAYDVALLYFAGHGLKYEKEDYLLPRDLSLEKDGSYGLMKKGLSVLELVRIGHDSGVKDNILVIDACRNESANWLRGDAIETGQIEPPENCCIFYSTGSGKTAEDWSSSKDQNSPFAKAFLSCISVPGEKLVVAFENTRTQVYNSTLKKQNPVCINRLSSDFVFYRMSSSAGALSVTSSPSGASVFIDGRDSKEKTEAIIGELSPGSHSVDLKLDGYKDFHTSVQINSGMTSMLSIAMEKESSSSVSNGTSTRVSTTNTEKKSSAPVIPKNSRVNQSLASYYSFDNKDADDESGNDLDAVASGGVQFVEDTPSGTGYAARMNGYKKAYINVPYNVFAGKTNYSISFWIKDFDYGMIVTAISSDGPRSDFPRILATTGNKFRFFTCYDNWDTTERFDYDTSVIKDSEWHHVVVTCAQTGNTYGNEATRQLYVDGKLVSVDKGTVHRYYHVHGYDEDIIGKIQIGGDRNGTYDHSTSMIIDNVRFYTVAISKQVVQDLYQLKL